MGDLTVRGNAASCCCIGLGGTQTLTVTRPAGEEYLHAGDVIFCRIMAGQVGGFNQWLVLLYLSYLIFDQVRPLTELLAVREQVSQVLTL